jgi:hypothetical protein
MIFGYCGISLHIAGISTVSYPVERESKKAPKVIEMGRLFYLATVLIDLLTFPNFHDTISLHELS